MSNLTEQWKKGELEVLDKLIEIVEITNQNRALSDEYLKDNGHYAREDYDTIVGEYEYGIVFVMADFILPYLKQVQQLRKFLEEFNALDVAKENQQLKELLSKARDSVQFDYYEAIGGGADYQAKFLKDLLTKIDNAIGEKK